MGSAARIGHWGEGGVTGKRVGIAGLGIMGSAIWPNLAAAGFDVIGYDPDAARVAAFRAAGGRPVPGLAAMAKETDAIVSLLPSVRALEEVVSGPLGIVASKVSNLVLIECSTLPIAAKLDARDRLAVSGNTALDCPLSGTGAQAAAKDLGAYASGERAAFDGVAPVIAGFCDAVHYVGAFGNGSRMKFVANLLVSIHNASTAEAFVLGMKAGLDPRDIMEVVRGGAGGSRMFDVRGPMMVEEAYLPATMKVSIWQKDVSIISDFARGLDCPVPLFAAAAQLYSAAMARGLGDHDTAAICQVLEEMARVERDETAT